MKFIFADSIDVVDPGYDFKEDRNASGRVRQHDDEYPHEFLETAPYDGILVSRAIVGDPKHTGKYSEAQMMRFRRDGARRFLRYPEDRYPGSLLFGDCGAFSYRAQKKPPYTIADTVEFYADGGFTHGCSVDHLIFDFDDEPGRERNEIADDTRDRYDLTLELASGFIKEARLLGKRFTPLGVVQGWSAPSMADAATRLVAMGYTYLAIGGLVPLKSEQIHRALAEIRKAIPSSIRLHLLGFGKIEELGAFASYGVASFDTTSPLLRAFKDNRKNYWARSSSGALTYYTAIRIPQAITNARLQRKAKRGHLNQETLKDLESKALTLVRDYANGTAPIDDALDAVLGYWVHLNWKEDGAGPNSRALTAQRDVYRETLAARPWESCECRVCREGGVEAVIFRASNRNKRRGIHNLQIFYNHLKSQTQVAA